MDEFKRPVNRQEKVGTTPPPPSFEHVDWKKHSVLMAQDMLVYSEKVEKANHIALSEAQHQLLR